MNLNTRKIRRLNITWFFNRRCLWRCCLCCLSSFLLLGQRASSCTVCLNISLPFIQLLLFVQEHPSLIKLLFKFQNVLRHTKSQNSLACNPNIKEDIPTALEVFYCFETKQKDINRSSTKTSMQRASNIPGRTGCNV